MLALDTTLCHVAIDDIMRICHTDDEMHHSRPPPASIEREHAVYRSPTVEAELVSIIALNL
jgi:hypothetical protein